MKFLRDEKEKRQMVRIIIGSTEQGMKGLTAPTKSITLLETSVEEVYKIIEKALILVVKK